MKRNLGKSSMHFDASPALFEKAKENRDNPTEAEKAFWQLVRNNALGFKFRRQHPVGQFILDFFCYKAMTGVELDGEYHLEEDQKEYDKGREYMLEEMGISVIRFKNSEVLTNPRQVTEKVIAYLEERQSQLE